MHPRWHPAESSPLVPQSAGDSAVSRREWAPLPIPDLESQLSAALDGASWAVAAFAPADSLWADWLYRNLNGYPVAAPLIGQRAECGMPRPDCVSVFPDRRDPDYAAHYPRALEKSGYLVVVCSPRSAHCAEVDARICAFKNAGGEERIIALVVEGEPDSDLENAPKTAEPAWLPAWLRWRLAGDAFSEADRGEPRIVDARPGRTSLKEVRDLLLATLLEVDAWELEILGNLARPVENVQPAPKPAVVAPPAVVQVAPRAVAEPQRKVRPVVLTAAICVCVTLAFAWWAFGRGAGERTPMIATQEPAAAAMAPEPADQPSILEPEVAAPSPLAPTDDAPAPASVVQTLPVESIAVPAPATIPSMAAAALAEENATRAAVLDLHRRGDAAVRQRRMDEALGFYEEAVDTARATAPRASAESKADAALLCRKLGTLQLQMASTAEARASFVQGRKLLVQLKTHGQWNAERAKILAEIETGLRRLPRD